MNTFFLKETKHGYEKAPIDLNFNQEPKSDVTMMPFYKLTATQNEKNVSFAEI